MEGGLNTVVHPPRAVEYWVPGYVGRPTEYKTLPSLADAGEYVGRGYQCSRVFNRPGCGGRWNTPYVPSPNTTRMASSREMVTAAYNRR